LDNNITKTVSIYKHDGLKVMLVTDQHTIDEVLDAFTNVLRGSGYYFDGEVDITDYESAVKDSEEDEEEEI